MTKKINVAVICGGVSNERDISLKSGQQVARSLPAKYSTHLIEIQKDGKWLLGSSGQQQILAGAGKAIVPHEPGQLGGFDVAFIAMHGKFGEDGKIQALLETLGVPYTGSGVLASALGMNKRKTLELVSKYGIKTPEFIFLYSLPKSKIELTELKRIIAKKIGYPCIIKPNESGSSLGISIIKKEKEVQGGLRKAFNEDSEVLIEEYIKGIELTCAVIGNSGRTPLVALPALEIVTKNDFFDYDAKYSKETQEICPARINIKQTEELQKLSKNIHEIIGCDGLSRSDFILGSKNNFYFLEINTIPGLTEHSLSPKEAAAAGMTFPEFLEKQVQLALLKKKIK